MYGLLVPELSWILQNPLSDTENLVSDVTKWSQIRLQISQDTFKCVSEWIIIVGSIYNLTNNRYSSENLIFGENKRGKLSKNSRIEKRLLYHQIKVI